jgi:hypothetical protein
VTLTASERGRADGPEAMTPAHDEQPGSSRARVVELIGLPGAGKSTLVQHLLRLGDGRVERIGLGRWRSAARLIRNAPTVSVPFLRQVPSMPIGRKWHRFSLMVQLQTMSDLVSMKRSDALDLLILDQGPVYMLSGIGRARATPVDRNSPAFEAYWRRTLSAWAALLDVVIVLEASDDALYERIMQRPSPHRVKDMSKDEASVFFAKFRQSQRRMVSQIVSEGEVTVLPIRTDLSGVAETASRILTLAAAPGRG